MSYMKYIMLKNGSIILFTEDISHKEMADRFGGRENVASAGQTSFVLDNENQVGAFGESLTLGIRSDNTDAKRLYNAVSMYA